MTTLSTYLTNYYRGIQGVQGITGPQGLQGIQGIQGIVGIGTTVTNVGLATTSGSSYTFTTNDIGKFVSLSSGGGTISSNIFISGDVITIFNNSNSNQNITFASGINAYGIGVTVGYANTVGITSNQYMSILCVDNNKFIVY
jgi:hypothetical protein